MEGMVLLGLVLLGPLPPSCLCRFSRFDGGAEGIMVRGLVLLSTNCPVNTVAFRRFDEEVGGVVLRGLVPWCPLPRT